MSLEHDKGNRKVTTAEKVNELPQTMFAILCAPKRRFNPMTKSTASSPIEEAFIGARVIRRCPYSLWRLR
jgi:hypothetical protein